MAYDPWQEGIHQNKLTVWKDIERTLHLDCFPPLNRYLLEICVRREILSYHHYQCYSSIDQIPF